LCLALWLGGCAGEGSLDDPRAFRILGGSELKDLRETGLLDYIQKKSGIKIYLEENGSLAAVEKISGGQHPYDALWIPNGFYPEAFRSEIKNPPLVMEKIFMSPVTVGVRRDLAERFGWLGPEGLAREDLSWNDIREKAVRGELQLYMTHMHTSNSGALASLALAHSLLGKADPLTLEDWDNPQLVKGMEEFFAQGIKKTAGSSGWLADVFWEEKGEAIVNYENVLAELNLKGAGLVLIYPREGVFVAGYPFYLLKEEKRADYEKILAVLKSPEFQKKAMELTQRRLLHGNIPLNLKGGIDAQRVIYTLSLPQGGKGVETGHRRVSGTGKKAFPCDFCGGHKRLHGGGENRGSAPEPVKPAGGRPQLYRAAGPIHPQGYGDLYPLQPPGLPSQDLRGEPPRRH